MMFRLLSLTLVLTSFAAPLLAAEELLVPDTTASAPQAAAPASPAKGSSSPSLMQGNSDEPLDITADNSLEWNETEQLYVARGNAKAKRGDVLIEADVLKAYNRKNSQGTSEVWKMTAEGNVRVSSKENVATGENAVYDIDSRKAVLTGRNLTLKTPSDQVSADESLEYWEVEQVALARGNAVAIREGRKVTSDEMIAHMKPDKKGELAIETMQARGNVSIVTADDAVTCDDVVYNLANNTAILNGNVNISRGANQLKGNRVETDFKTGKSRLLSAGKGRVHALITSAKGKSTGASTAPAVVTPFMVKTEP
jgi:lipopolysaccharide export system protein LptA